MSGARGAAAQRGADFAEGPDRSRLRPTGRAGKGGLAAGPLDQHGGGPPEGRGAGGHGVHPARLPLVREAPPGARGGDQAAPGGHGLRAGRRPPAAESAPPGLRLRRLGVLAHHAPLRGGRLPHPLLLRATRIQAHHGAGVFGRRGL
ncbi:unnamed protein product [Effrenium voratum]|nr:unnamed protein product [Effrenium voratum]